MTPVDGWTEGRYNSFITSTLRSGMRRWPPKWQCLKNSLVGKKKGKSGREAAHYKCAGCSGEFTSKDVQIDHISPVVDPAKGFTTWDEFISRLFCSVENLQTLCTTCHKRKTLCEKQTRTKTASLMPAPPPKKRQKPPSTSSSKMCKPTRKVASGARASGKALTKKPKKSGATC